MHEIAESRLGARHTSADREWFLESVRSDTSFGLGFNVMFFESGWCLLLTLGPWSLGFGRDLVAAIVPTS